MISSAISGFALGFSLILAIGSQNAFVLRQGLRGEHVFVVCLICAVSDAILISAGVIGFTAITENVPWLEPAMRIGGALFLTIYGLISFYRAWKVESDALTAAEDSAQSFRSAVLTCLAFTWLNPHVYLDTVALIGAVSTQSSSQLGFGIGAVIASFVFFFSLGYGAALLRPLLSNPRAWRVLDFGIGLIMLSIAAKLVFSR